MRVTDADLLACEEPLLGGAARRLHDDLTALAAGDGVAIAHDLHREDGADGGDGSGRCGHAEARPRGLRSERDDHTAAHEIEQTPR